MQVTKNTLKNYLRILSKQIDLKLIFNPTKAILTFFTLLNINVTKKNECKKNLLHLQYRGFSLIAVECCHHVAVRNADDLSLHHKRSTISY